MSPKQNAIAVTEPDKLDHGTMCIFTPILNEAMSSPLSENHLQPTVYHIDTPLFEPTLRWGVYIGYLVTRMFSHKAQQNGPRTQLPEASNKRYPAG